MQRIFISVIMLSLCACARNMDYQRKAQANSTSFQTARMQNINPINDYDLANHAEPIDDTIDRDNRTPNVPIDIMSNQQNLTHNSRSDNSASRSLRTCIYEAKQLNRITGNAYSAQVNELYRNIKAAQYYATVYADISNNTSQMVTPLYKFKINDNCNTISQALLRELKKRVGSAGKN